MNPRTTRTLRRSAVVASLLSAACGSLGAQTASAVPVSTTLNYTCNFPLLLPQSLKLRIDTDIPDVTKTDTLTNPFALNATASVSAASSFGLNALGATTIEGTAAAAATINLTTGKTLKVTVNTTIAKTTLPTDGSAFTTTAVGETPQLSFSKPGTASITVGDLVLSLVPRIADGTLSGLDSFESECKQDAGQNNTLATIKVLSDDTTAPSQPGTVVGVPSPTSVALSWGASTDDTGVTGYDVYQNGTKVQTVTGNTANVAGLTPSTAYAFKVVALDAAGNQSTASASTTVTTTADTTSTTNYSYAIAGSATLKTLTKGTVPVNGSVNTSVTRATGALTGDLVLNPATAKLTALGFLPVTAQVQFASTAPVTGTVTTAALNASAKVRIKLPSISVVGVQLAGGSNCQASQVSTIPLKSVGTTFNPAVGGAIAGTFSISNLSGCGFLNGIVSPLTSGSGNAIALSLTPKPTA